MCNAIGTSRKIKNSQTKHPNVEIIGILNESAIRRILSRILQFSKNKSAFTEV